ncbi:MAG: fumarate hydratase [Bacilli bacterium]|jgi:fumarate hydratase subunit alpha|nr:fumarate hydratase [Bacilli bacterium]HHU24326.1 fumarate hydratase [Acholeplasmataceae bacterium]
MRKLDLNLVTQAVKKMLIEACEKIPVNVIERLREAKEKEANPLGKSILDQIIENGLLAMTRHVPICQDTGMVVCFLEIGSQVVFDGDIYEAINRGVREAYIDGYLRKSVVRHPLDRVNTKDNTPAIIHTKIIPGETVKITVAPKGAGSENMSLVKMLIPADGIEGIKKLVLDTIFNAGGKPCPPIIVGIGLGGNLEKSAFLAKEAVLREIDDEATDPIARQLEQELLQEINDLGVGPMGLGGTVTALAVKVNTYPCHIASLPVAINIQCHASRHKSVVL